MFKKKPFKVKFTGRAGILYSESERSVIIDSEFLAGQPGIVIWEDSIKEWELPTSKVALTDEEKKRIKNNINEFLTRDGISVEWA